MAHAPQHGTATRRGARGRRCHSYLSVIPALQRHHRISEICLADEFNNEPPVTCLDPRCVPEQFFGPDLGFAVIRNAGGRATKDAINSITILRSLGNAASVFVIHHTGSRRLLLQHVKYPLTNPSFELIP